MISSTQKATYNPKFGMALYMPRKEKLAKIMGTGIAYNLDKCRPELEQSAKDVDIIVKPIKKKTGNNNCIDLQVTPKYTSIPLLRFLEHVTSVLKHQKCYDKTVRIYDINKENIIRQVQKAKEVFFKDMST